MGTGSLRIFSWGALWSTAPSTSCGLAFMAAPACCTLASDKPGASGAPGVCIPHCRSLCASPLLTVAPQTRTGCFQAPHSAKELPQLFGPFGRLWLRHDDSGDGETSTMLSRRCPGQKGVTSRMYLPLNFLTRNLWQILWHWYTVSEVGIKLNF